MRGEKSGFDVVEIVECTGNRGLSPLVPPRQKWSARPKRAVLLCVATLLCSAALAQQEPEPPLPLPTEAQLQRGRELLDKIVYVITSVPLSDAPAVLKVFGFTELNRKEYPDHAWVGVNGHVGDFAQMQELAGTGFSDIVVQPWIDDPHHDVVARFFADFALGETCVTMDDARRVLESIATAVTSKPMRYIHPVQRPKPLHETGGLSFFGLRTPLYPVASITFTFEYQTCAQSFGFTYRKANKETRK